MCVTETEFVEQALHLCLDVGKFTYRRKVVFRQFAGGRHDAVKVFLSQHQGTVDKVAVDGHELVVVAGLEVFPREVVVLRLGSVGRQHVAQHVLLAGQLLKILVEPDGPVARGGNFAVLQIQEFVGRDVVGQDVAALGTEHGGKNDAVEHNVVLADKVYQPGRGVFPPRFPRIGQQFLRVGDIANGRVEPDVKHFAVGAFDGNRNTPVQVAAYGTRL